MKTPKITVKTTLDQIGNLVSAYLVHPTSYTCSKEIVTDCTLMVYSYTKLLVSEGLFHDKRNILADNFEMRTGKNGYLCQFSDIDETAVSIWETASTSVGFEDDEVIGPQHWVIVFFYTYIDDQNDIEQYEGYHTRGLDCDSLAHYQNCRVPPRIRLYSSDGTFQHSIFRSAEWCHADRHQSSTRSLLGGRKARWTNGLKSSRKRLSNVSKPCEMLHQKSVESLPNCYQNLTSSSLRIQSWRQKRYPASSASCAVSFSKNTQKRSGGLQVCLLSSGRNINRNSLGNVLPSDVV